MTKDNLKNYIDNNRQSFDDSEPSAELWNKINSQLPKQRDFSWVWKLAAAIFFCTSLYLLSDKLNDKPEPDVLAAKEKLANDFGDVESYYFQIISQKRDLIYQYDSAGTLNEVDFEQDMQKLDAMYQVLKDELKTNPSKKVVDALVLNLLVRIDVLNEKIEDLETGTPKEDEDNGDVSI